MSIWTSDRRSRSPGAVLKSAALLLAALLAMAMAAPAVAQGPSGGAPLRVTVDGRAIVVAGPSGYCVDRSASREGTEGAFVLLGSCAALGGGRAAPKAAPAVLIATVAPGASGEGLGPEGFAGLATFFTSEPGRAALSRAGTAESVQVLEVLSVGDVLYLRIEDRAAAEGQALAPEYWRAVLSLRGRMVTLSALSEAGRPLPAGGARAVLEAFVARMQAANPSRPADP